MTVASRTPHDPDGAGIVAWVQTIGLRGFAKSRDRQAVPAAASHPTPSGSCGDGADIVAMLCAKGIRGFGSPQNATGRAAIPNGSKEDGGDVIRLVRDIGLRGFTPAPAVSSEAADTTPIVQPAAQRTVSQVAAPVSIVPTVKAPPVATTSAAPKLSKARFLQIAVAPGGHAALAALEGKLGMPITGAQSQKLTRTVADGGEIRAFMLPGDVASESKISDVMGQLGDPALTASMGPIDLSQFAMVGGRGGKPWPPQLRPGVIAGLRRVLAR